MDMASLVDQGSFENTRGYSTRNKNTQGERKPVPKGIDPSFTSATPRGDAVKLMEDSLNGADGDKQHKLRFLVRTHTLILPVALLTQVLSSTLGTREIREVRILVVAVDFERHLILALRLILAV
jgi:hypothetical protein